MLFLNLFLHFREYPVVSMLKQNSCHEVHASLIYIYLFHSHIISNLFVSKSKVKFCGKSFPLPIIYHDYNIPANFF